MITFMTNFTVYTSNMYTPANVSYRIDLVTFWVIIINLDSHIGKYRDYIMPAYHSRNSDHGSELPISTAFSSWVFYILFIVRCIYEVVRYVYGSKAGVCFQHLLQPKVNPSTVNEHL